MSHRLDQVNELVHREVAEYLREHIEFPRDLFVTVTKVETAPDLKHGKVFVSVLPFTKRHHALKILEYALPEAQSALNGRLVMHHIPRIRFVLDDTIERASGIEAILDEIKKEDGGNEVIP